MLYVLEYYAQDGPELPNASMVVIGLVVMWEEHGITTRLWLKCKETPASCLSRRRQPVSLGMHRHIRPGWLGLGLVENWMRVNPVPRF